MASHRSLYRVVFAGLVAFSLTRGALADELLPFWMDRTDVPLPEGVRSVEVVRDDEALLSAPGGGTRRGLVVLGARLPLLGVVRGAGCATRWLLVGPMAYVCESKVRLSSELPGLPAPRPDPADGMPFRYYFVGANGADAYDSLSDFDSDTLASQLDRGWAISSTEERSHGSTAFVVTRREHRFVPRRQLTPAIAPVFHGEPVDKQAGLNFAWVLTERANVFDEPKANRKPVGVRTRFERVVVQSVEGSGKQRWVRIDAKQWVREADLRIPQRVSPPAQVRRGERWIDVDTATQTLVAYEGAEPVYATLVSTGKASTPTPRGVFRIWVKIRSSTMSNRDEASADLQVNELFSLDDVPWVQFFSAGVALHGAFWHRQFGYAHSHGCVNLPPIDAMWLYRWTLPRVPTEWDAAFPTDAEPATIVSVR